MNNQFKSQPPRLYEDYSRYFLTFNAYKRIRVLCYKEIPQFLSKELIFQCRNLNINLIAYVILPEHIHLILECSLSKNISHFLKRYKSYTSRKIKELSYIKKEYIWQRGTFDHIIREGNDFENHLNYIHLNPVKHGYVSKPEDWKWSSFKYYLDEEYYQLGWGHEKIDFGSKKKYGWGE